MKFLILLALGLAVTSAQIKGTTRGAFPIKGLPVAPVVHQRFYQQQQVQVPVTQMPITHLPMTPVAFNPLVHQQRIYQQQQVELPITPLPIPHLPITPVTIKPLITPVITNPMRSVLPNVGAHYNDADEELIEQSHQVPFIYHPQVMQLPLVQTRAYLPQQQIGVRLIVAF